MSNALKVFLRIIHTRIYKKCKYQIYSIQSKWFTAQENITTLHKCFEDQDDGVFKIFRHLYGHVTQKVKKNQESKKPGKLLSTRKNSLSDKIRIYALKCFMFFILLYGCESCSLDPSMEKKIEAMKVYLYRRILQIS